MQKSIPGIKTSAVHTVIDTSELPGCDTVHKGGSSAGFPVEIHLFLRGKACFQHNCAVQVFGKHEIPVQKAPCGVGCQDTGTGDLVA